ncbi:hypothetical protein [Streptacidiphilus fuscans]|uniref:Uncharacterized protein n=1 Tax=Streptacidiphilus fuscans TaxID=2789292 RepID=A0A931FCA2_9ACTN|nr:hypothetical protein [Streptacidiphilus fuscans]MBF9066965.1 hypothetical protein [Streptacidiphilus fuscans]
MRIELTWQRADAADRVLTIPVPDVLAPRTPQPDAPAPEAHLVPPRGSGLLEDVLLHAEPVAASAASALGLGLLAQIALPFAAKLARQALTEQR